MEGEEEKNEWLTVAMHLSIVATERVRLIIVQAWRALLGSWSEAVLVCMYGLSLNLSTLVNILGLFTNKEL